MKKIIIILTALFLTQINVSAKDSLIFDFPNEGWHKVMSPDGVASKKCYVPYNQTGENYTEMLVLSEKILKNNDISALSMLHRQLGKDKNNYPDIMPEYVFQDMNDAMITWCSRVKNTCTVQRAFQGPQGIIFASYINKMPHYSQNIFGQWSNILMNIKANTSNTPSKNIIELD